MGNRKGFTLLELLIGIVILSIGLLSLAQLQLVAVKRNSFAQKITQATVFTQEKLEDLRRMGYGDVTGVSEGSQQSAPPSSGNFTRTWFWNSTSTNGLVKMTVTSSWNDERGKSHSVSLSSLIARGS